MPTLSFDNIIISAGICIVLSASSSITATTTGAPPALTCQLLLKPFDLLVQLLDLFVSSQSSSSSWSLQGLCRLYGERSEVRRATSSKQKILFT